MQIAETILVIDDNVDTVDSLSALIEAVGYMAVRAYSGKDGVEAALKTAPAVALVDLVMPGLDGFAVARILRSEFGKGIFVIAVSGKCDQATQQQCLDGDFDEFVPKPIHFPILLQLLASR